MNKKHIINIQIILVSIGVILILLTYFYYPYIKKNKIAEVETNQDDLKVDNGDEKTTFFDNATSYTASSIPRFPFINHKCKFGFVTLTLLLLSSFFSGPFRHCGHHPRAHV